MPDTKLTPRGRTIRVIATALGSLLIVAGTFIGQDDWFPFAPFRMYSTATPPDSPIPIARVEAIDVTGHRFVIDEANSGIRRAEVEGSLDRMREDDELVAALGEAYLYRNPDAADIVTVEVILRWHELDDGSVTGEYTDEVVAVWQR